MARHWGLGGLLVAVALALPFVGLSDYYMRLVNLALLFSLLATSLNIVLGYAGQISLGHAGFFGIGAYTSALLTSGRSGLLFWPAFLAAGLVSAAFGVAIGVPTLRLKGHYLALATLGFGEIMGLLFLNCRELTHGMDGVSEIPAPTLGPLTFATNRQFYFLALAVLVVTLLLTRAFEVSKFGRRLAAVRDAEVAAGASGVNVTRIKVGALTASAFIAGLAGSLYAHLLSYISPDVFTFDLTAQLLSMVVIGGAGTLFGPVLGAATLTFLPEVLRISNVYYQLLYGAGIVAMIVFLPTGLWGWARRHLAGPAAPVRDGAPEAGQRVAPATPAPVGTGAASSPLLDARKVTRRFGGLIAVNELDLAVREGSIHALVGPNGSGKSTFINLASGIYKLNDGSIRLNGADIGNRRPWTIANLGLVRTFQNLRLFSSLTVEANVLVACQTEHEIGLGAALLGLPRARTETAALHLQARAAMDFAGVTHLKDRIVRTLPHESQRMVEIARAFAKQPRLLMLDEPAAGLNPGESDRLIERILGLRARGITVLLVEHNMPLVMRVADRITVLNFGKKIAEGTPDEIRMDPTVAEAYLGRRLTKRLQDHAASRA
jgi:branched-chain amino acid transport system permease protein